MIVENIKGKKDREKAGAWISKHGSSIDTSLNNVGNVAMQAMGDEEREEDNLVRRGSWIIAQLSGERLD